MIQKYRGFIPHKGIELQTSKLIDSLFIGNYKTRIKGNGLEFVDFKEYDFGDDVRKIDFLKSSYTGKTLVKLFEEERELSVYFLYDIKYFSEEKRNIFLHLIHLIGFGALKGGDKVGAYFDNTLSPARKGKSNFIHIIQNIDTFLERQKVGENVQKKSEKNTLEHFNNLNIKKSLVFLCSDNLDIDEKQLKIGAIKNDLIVVNIFSHFENYLDDSGVVGFEKLGSRIFIDLDDTKKKNAYRNLRQSKIKECKKKVFQAGADYIFLDEKKDFYKELYALMQKR